MKLAAVLAVVAVLVTGCPSNSGLGQVMGREAPGTPVPEKRQLDCDLIFPGPDSR